MRGINARTRIILLPGNPEDVDRTSFDFVRGMGVACANNEAFDDEICPLPRISTISRGLGSPSGDLLVRRV